MLADQTSRVPLASVVVVAVRGRRCPLVGQDTGIVSYLERFGDEPSVPSRAQDDESPVTIAGGHVVGTPAAAKVGSSAQQASDQDFFGGDDGTRTHDFLLAKQVL